MRKLLWFKVGKIADKKWYMRKWFGLLNKVPEKEIYGYYRNWYECSQDTVFEGKVFQEIKDYDSYLSFKFGNYMELPPVESRKVHPVSEIKVI